MHLFLPGDYTGLAERLLEEEFGGTALFVNGAQGTMDIDGLRDRDWEGMQRTGHALAAAVAPARVGLDRGQIFQGTQQAVQRNLFIRHMLADYRGLFR